MHKNKKIKIIFFSALALVFLASLIIYISAWPRSPQSLERLEESPPESRTAEIEAPSLPLAQNEKAPPAALTSSSSATLYINDTKFESPFQAGDSAYDIMARLKEEGRISFTEKTYAGMGKLITSINGIKSDGDMTWIYYLNGQEGTTSVSKIIINSGDVISWKYEKVKY